MLASITPLGERGRQSRWGVTMTAFVVGATAAGAALGALLGVVGAVAFGDGFSGRARLGVFAVVVCAGVVVEVLPRRIPGPRRQVNEHWLDEFRGWVYGLGFGAQLGLGVTTIVTSAATYVTLLAAVLTGDPALGAVVVGIYGALRGMTPLVSARVQRPEQLFAMHRWIERRRGSAARVSTALLAAVLVASTVGSLT
jgi:MFS family permease